MGQILSYIKPEKLSVLFNSIKGLTGLDICLCSEDLKLIAGSWSLPSGLMILIEQMETEYDRFREFSYMDSRCYLMCYYIYGERLYFIMRSEADCNKDTENALDLIYSVADTIKSDIEAVISMKNLEDESHEADSSRDDLSDGCWEYNIKENRYSYNAKWFKFVGYKSDDLDLIRDHSKYFIHAVDYPRVMRYINRRLRIKDVFSVDYRMRDKSGAWRWVNCRGKVSERNSSGIAIKVRGIIYDINKYKNKESKLSGLENCPSESERDYGQEMLESSDLFELGELIDDMPVCIMVYSSEDGVEFVNKAFTERYSYTLEDLQRLEMLRVRLSQVGAFTESGVRSDNIVFEDRLGVSRNARVSVSAWRGYNLAVFESSVENLSEIVNVQEELQRMQSIFDGIEETIYVSDPESYDILYLNNYGRNIISNYEGKKCYEAFHDLDAPCAFCTNNIIMGSMLGRTYSYEAYYEKRQGWYKCYNRAIKWTDGRYVRFELAIDMTDYHNLLEALSESEQLLKTTMDALDEVVCVVDRSSRINFYNKEFKHLAYRTGISREDYLGLELSEVFPLILEQGVIPKRIEEVYNSEEDQAFEDIYRLEDGDWELELRIILLKRGVNSGSVLLIGRDITKRKQAEREREKLIISLGNKNNEMEQFIYSVSHDLKSPIITIGGFMNFLKEDIISGNQDSALGDIKRIESATQIIQNRLDALLRLSRLGRSVSERRYESVYNMLDDVEEILHKQIEDSGVIIDRESGIDNIYVDRAKFLLVFQNIIENAIKFSIAGKTNYICIGQKILGKQKVIFIKDSGIGIEDIDNVDIFRLFFQLDKNSSGSGMGLAMVKRIMDAHGGRIWIESDGKNSGVTVYIGIH